MDVRSRLLSRLEEVCRLCPDMRLAQVIMTVGMLGEDSTGHSIWDLEDEELAAAVERFASDLSGRASEKSKEINSIDLETIVSGFAAGS